jgi:molybdopterin synthase sulfur carrier subunit
MNVELRFFATVREAVGDQTVEREFSRETTVRDVLTALEEEYRDLRGTLLDGNAIAPNVTVLRNGTHVTHLDGADSELTAGDRLATTPPITGG